MIQDLVIGIDSSTTATKVIAWDKCGKNIAEASSPITLCSPGSGCYEQDPQDWWNSAAAALTNLLHLADKERVAALAIANQRETFVALNKEGEPLRPSIIWLDERCKEQVDKFAGTFGEDRIHKITGKPKDYAPVAYRLAWMKEHEGDLFGKVNKFCDVQSYLVHKLTGQFRTSWASADPLGLFDLENKVWSSDILRQLEIDTDQLPETFRPGDLLGYVTRAAAEQSGLKAGTPVVAGGGDGQSAGLGVNALGPGRAYLNLGTAVVSGTFASNYIVDKAFRTMASCSSHGYYCETSLRAGTFLIDWFIKQILGTSMSQEQNIYDTLEEEAKQVAPGCEGLVVLPYWNAVMNPYWDTDARGCIIGLSSGHSRGHLYRAILEGIALEQTLATESVEQVIGNKTNEFALIGGGAKSKLWSQIIADTSNKLVLHMASDEASSLGAGISAAVASGWFPSFKEAAMKMTKISTITEPVPENVIRYRELSPIYRDIYPGLRGIFKRIQKYKTSPGKV